MFVGPWIRAGAVAASCWLGISMARAENRIALVIGNSNYATVTALPNPANDAKAMTRFLSSAGFEVVQAPDLTQSDMRTAIGNFASMVAVKGPDTVAMVFYAGHGLQVDGENYLVPVDARIEREADVPLQATRLADLMNALSAVPSKSRIVIVDACRNNPFSAINKTSGRGLAIVDAPNGSLVSYSTAPGTEALDGDGENSPYTTALLKFGHNRGVPIEQVLKRVRLSVSESTGQQQFPWESSSLITDFSFFPGSGGQEQPKPAKATPKVIAHDSGAEPARAVESWRNEFRSKDPREAYEIVVQEDRVEAYQAYLLLYPTQPGIPVVRRVLERRQLMIAWYEAVLINTPAAYQAFLASYGSSDYAVTANRLLERALARSLGNAASASAAACPCNQPSTPPARPRRTDLVPGLNSPAGPSSPANLTSPPTTVTGVSPPPAVYTDPAPPVALPPVYIPPARPPVVVVPPPRGCGGRPYPPSTGHNPTPPAEGGHKPTTGGGRYPPGATRPATPSGSVDKPPTAPDRPPVIHGSSPHRPPITHSRLQKTTGMPNSPAVVRRAHNNLGMHVNKRRVGVRQTRMPGAGMGRMMGGMGGFRY